MFATEFVTSNKLVLFDMDGTLADLSHRLHFVTSGNKDWDAFFKACPDDKPIVDVIAMLNLMHELGFVILIVSGRSSVMKEETIAWLAKYKIPYHDLFMRGKKDHRPDWQTKQDILTNIKMKYLGHTIFCAFDDRDQVVDMWRRNGIRCYQVANGGF